MTIQHRFKNLRALIRSGGCSQCCAPCRLGDEPGCQLFVGGDSLTDRMFSKSERSQMSSGDPVTHPRRGLWDLENMTEAAQECRINLVNPVRDPDGRCWSAFDEIDRKPFAHPDRRTVP